MSSWAARLGSEWCPVLLCLVQSGCCVFQSGPPASQFPTAGDAIARMRESSACSRAVSGDAKIDYFGEEGRVRGNVMYLASIPDSIRFDVFSPFGVMLSTLTSDGRDFALFDLQNKQYLYGPAGTCNVARFTRVPVPPFALVQLLRGEAPVLVHEPSAAQIAWECGRYVVRINSKHEAQEEIHLVPAPEDWRLPWQQQRVLVLEVSVVQQGVELYRAELSDHASARTAAPREDPDGIDPDIPPSGPECSAFLPRGVRLVVPDTDQDLLLLTKEVVHNPPLIEGAFQQVPPGGVVVRYAACQ